MSLPLDLTFLSSGAMPKGYPTRPRRRTLAAVTALSLALAGCAAPQPTQGSNAPRPLAIEPLVPPAQTAALPHSTADQTGPAETAPLTRQAALITAPVNNATDAMPEAETLDRLVTYHTVQVGEDMLDIARNYDLGFLEVKAANPGVDVWVPRPGSKIVLPNVHLLATRKDRGIMVNIAQMRLYRMQGGQIVETHPLGVGRDGLETPLGDTTVTRKAKDPSWYPTARMRSENPALPAMVGPGPENPLGNRAIYLGWPLYRIHGTNIPWGVGRRVSSGCLRMYPEDAEAFYENIEVGSPVTVVDEPIIAEWRYGRLWLEAHPTAEGWDALENDQPLPEVTVTTELVRKITDASPAGAEIDWDTVRKVVTSRRGYPVAISQ